MASEFLEILSPNALAELKQVEALVKTLASDIKSINNFKTSGTPSGADKNIKSLTDAYEKQAESIKKVSSGLKTVSLEERQALIDKKALTKELDLQAKAQSKLVGAYQNLVAKQQIAKRTLQDLVVAQGKNSVATKQAQLEYNKLTAKVNLANKATSNFSSSGLGKLATGFRNLLGAFG